LNQNKLKQVEKHINKILIAENDKSRYVTVVRSSLSSSKYCSNEILNQTVRMTKLNINTRKIKSQSSEFKKSKFEVKIHSVKMHPLKFKPNYKILIPSNVTKQKYQTPIIRSQTTYFFKFLLQFQAKFMFTRIFFSYLFFFLPSSCVQQI